MQLSRSLPAKVRRLFRHPSAGTYISALETVAAAERAGQTVEKYVEELWDQQGETAAIVERMRSASALKPADTVVEIGPGTGRYLARVAKIVRPRRHVIYETSADWRQWLVATYGVEAPPTDGETLAGVDSADVVHAHGVFVYTSFLVTARYLAEIVRVRPRWIVFDFYSAAEFNAAAIRRWLATEHRYPVILDRGWVLAQLPGWRVADEWTSPYGAGESRYLVLERGLAPQQRDPEVDARAVQSPA